MIIVTDSAIFMLKVKERLQKITLELPIPIPGVS